MSLKRYSIFDAANINNDLALEQGGAVVTTVTSGLGINGTVRGTVPQSEGTHDIEFIVYGTASTLANKVSIGVGTVAHPLTTYVGGTNVSVGYRMGEGQIHRNGGSVQSVTVGVIGDVVRLQITVTPDATRYSWSLNENFLYEYVVPATSPPDVLDNAEIHWYVSLGSTTEAADISVFVNSGRQLSEYPQFARIGWWEPVGLSGNLRISDIPYVSHPTDTVPSQRWNGIVDEGDFYIDRGVHFWPWGSSSNVRGSVLSVTCSDPDGLLDPALVGQYRDQPVEIRTGAMTASYDVSTLIGKYVVEDVEVTSELERRITCRDSMARLEAPLQRRYFRPDTAEGVAFRPWPTLIGACYSVPLTLMDELEYRYAIDAQGIQQAGRVRDSGDPFYNVGSPTEYTVESGGQTLVLGSVPRGIITMDASVASGASYVPPSAVDVLEGIGSPFTDTLVPGKPDYWLEWYTPADAVYVTGTELQFGNLSSTDFYAVQAFNPGSPEVPVQLIEGRTYLIRTQLVVVQNPTLTVLLRSIGIFSELHSSSAIIQTTVGGTFGIYYTPITTHNLYIGFETTNVIRDYAGAVKYLTVDLLPILPSEDDDEELEEALNPLPLENAVTELIVNRAGLTDLDYSTADLAAIDTVTGYAGVGYFAEEQVTTRSAIDAILNGYTTSPYLDRAGTIRFLRLVAPEDQSYTKTLTSVDMLSPPLPSWDRAEGITRRFGVRRNERILQDADLVTDEVDVTLRLRRKLSQRHRIQVAYGGPLAAGLEAADAAEPLDSRLVKRIDGQTEINRVGAMYATARAFYTTTVKDREDIEIGDVVLVTYPRFGLITGRNLLVVRIRQSQLENTQTLTLWGAYS